MCIGHDFGVDLESWWAELLTWNETCQPPWEHGELRAKLSGVYRRGYAQKPFGWRLVESMDSTPAHGPLNWESWKPMTEYERKQMQWLLRPFLALGRVHDVSGPGGGGKNTVLQFIVAALSRGVHPVTGAGLEKAYRTLWITSEEDLEEDARPRLEDMGAALDMVTVVTPSEFNGQTLDLMHARDQLSAAIIGGQYDIVVFDPITSFMPGADGVKTVDLVPRMDELNALARETHVTIINIRNWKKGGDSAVHKGAGATTFTDKSRVAMAVVRVPDDEGRAVHVLTVTKGNRSKLKSGLRFELHAPHPNYPALARLLSTEIEEIDIEELANPAPPSGKSDRAVKDPMDAAIRECLSFECRPSLQIYNAVADRLGIDKETRESDTWRRAVRRRANALGMVIVDNFGGPGLKGWKLAPASDG